MLTAIPDFPSSYSWIVDRHLVGFAPFTQLQPWFFIEKKSQFYLMDRFQNYSELNGIAFARRQDNDLLACYQITTAQPLKKIVVVNGWTASGFDVVCEHASIWDWLKSSIDDVANWSGNREK